MKQSQRLTLAAVFTIAGLVLGGCVSPSGSTSNSSNTDKYKQTWSKTYASTTCQEWKSAMSDKQQWVAAADMLTAARNKKDGGNGLPPDALVTTFQGGITTSCVVPSAKVAEIGAALYLTERAQFRP